MLTKLEVQNFRSIENCDVEFAPITIFFGPTSSGKSTLFYALLVLRNFILSPTQAVDGLFNLGFQNLGGFEACIFNHAASKAMGVTARFGKRQSYGLHLRKTDADINEGSEFLPMEAKVPIPYGANQSWPFSYTEKDEEFVINWNGFAATVSSKSGTPEAQAKAVSIAAELNAPVEAIKRVDVCPHRRGFFKPSYSPAPLTPTPTSEDEVATLIINDQNSPPRISINTVEIFDRDFRTHTAPGTATTFLQTTEQKGARVLTHLATEEEKQLAFTTHSEQFLLSILACVKEGLLSPDQLRCYHVSREKKQTTFTYEPVSGTGQISGGLSSFMEGELQDIKSFLSVSQ